MSFLTLRNGIYQYNLFRGDAQPRIRITTGIPKEQERAAREAKLRLDAQHGVLDLNILDLATYYNANRPAELAEKTVKKKVDALKTLARSIGNKPIAALTRIHFEEYKRKRQTEVKEVSVNCEIRSLRSVFTYAIEIGIIKEHPMKGVKQFQNSGEEAAYITREQCEALIDTATAPWVKDIIRIAFDTGMRPGEVANLTCGAVNLAARTVTIKTANNWQPKKRKVRTIPLSPAVVQTLAKYITTTSRPNDADKPLFSYKRSTMYAKVKEAIIAAGLPDRISFKSLRHSFATERIQQGVPIDVVRRFLGHSSIALTDKVYSHITVATMHEHVSHN